MSEGGLGGAGRASPTMPPGHNFEAALRCPLDYGGRVPTNANSPTLLMPRSSFLRAAQLKNVRLVLTLLLASACASGHGLQSSSRMVGAESGIDDYTQQ